MPDTTAQIAGKGCQSTGITEDLAVSLHNNLGKKLMAVVELEVASRSENADGKEKVGLRITTIEPAPNSDTEDHLRNLQRSFHYERKLAEDGPQLPTPGDDIEPKVADLLAAGKALEPHEFEADQFDEGDCNLCGQNLLAGIHHSGDDPDPDAA